MCLIWSPFGSYVMFGEGLGGSIILPDSSLAIYYYPRGRVNLKGSMTARSGRGDQACQETLDFTESEWNEAAPNVFALSSTAKP